MERWQNRVAVVTGASAGIGAACCRQLLAKGLIVVGFARRLNRMEELKAQLPTPEQQKRFHARECDITDEAQVTAAFHWVDETLGGADVLVNNAGIMHFTRIITANTSDLRETLETNVLSVAVCTRVAFQSMQRRGVHGGHILIINSLLGHRVAALPGISTNMYAPSKFAITALTEVLRQEFQHSGLQTKITSISPGMVDTEFLNSVTKTLPTMPPSLNAEDVAEAVIYALQTAPHVQVQDILLRSIGQIS